MGHILCLSNPSFHCNMIVKPKAKRKNAGEGIVFSIRTMEDVQKLLKWFGTWIYTGDRLGDLEMMEEELEELYRLGLIDKDTYLSARRVIMDGKRMSSK